MAKLRRGADGRYWLGPPVIPAQENHPARQTWDPTFELGLWKQALGIAQTWRRRLSLAPVPNGTSAANASPRHRQGRRLPGSRELSADLHRAQSRTIHPCCTLWRLKGEGVDRETMRRTLRKVLDVWKWADTWGWDFPAVAMTAARLGEPPCVDACSFSRPKHLAQKWTQWQRPNLPLYLPGNGSAAIGHRHDAGAGGWTRRPAPGFPKKGLERAVPRGSSARCEVCGPHDALCGAGCQPAAEWYSACDQHANAAQAEYHSAAGCQLPQHRTSGRASISSGFRCRNTKWHCAFVRALAPGARRMRSGLRAGTEPVSHGGAYARPSANPASHSAGRRETLSTGSCFIPARLAGKKHLPLFVHFHGARWLPEVAAARDGPPRRHLRRRRLRLHQLRQTILRPRRSSAPCCRRPNGNRRRLRPHLADRLERRPRSHPRDPERAEYYARVEKVLLIGRHAHRLRGRQAGAARIAA